MILLLSVSKLIVSCLVFKTPPFRIEEKGWGEFYVYIVCHIAERGGEQTITHDLNFRESEYEVLHTMNFPSNKPGLLRLLAESGPVPEKKSSGPVATGSPAIPKAATASVTSSSSIDGPAASIKRKQAASTNGGADDGSAKFKKKAKIEKGSVDLEQLADGLKQLGEDELFTVVQMVTDNLAPGMYIKNDVKEGEFHMDLFTLPDPLLKSLWEYVKKRVSV